VPKRVQLTHARIIHVWKTKETLNIAQSLKEVLHRILEPKQKDLDEIIPVREIIRSRD